MGRADRIRIRQKLLNINPVCFWCGNKFPIFSEIKNRLKVVTPEVRKRNLMDIPTLEHLISKPKYDRDFERNLRLSCFRCNK